METDVRNCRRSGLQQQQFHGDDGVPDAHAGHHGASGTGWRWRVDFAGSPRRTGASPAFDHRPFRSRRTAHEQRGRIAAGCFQRGDLQPCRNPARTGWTRAAALEDGPLGYGSHPAGFHGMGDRMSGEVPGHVRDWVVGRASAPTVADPGPGGDQTAVLQRSPWKTDVRL